MPCPHDFSPDNAPADTAAATIESAQANLIEASGHYSVAERVDHSEDVSHSTAPNENQVLDQDSGGRVPCAQVLTYEDPRDVARRLMPQYDLDPNEFDCLNKLLTCEGDSDPTADTPTRLPTTYPKPSSAAHTPTSEPSDSCASGTSRNSTRCATPLRSRSLTLSSSSPMGWSLASTSAPTEAVPS